MWYILDAHNSATFLHNLSDFERKRGYITDSVRSFWELISPYLVDRNVGVVKVLCDGSLLVYTMSLLATGRKADPSGERVANIRDLATELLEHYDFQPYENFSQCRIGGSVTVWIQEIQGSPFIVIIKDAVQANRPSSGSPMCDK